MSENNEAVNKIYPRIMFAAPKSGSGKTLITCGFLEILKRRGINTISFKCGPDYIDPIFHSFVTGRAAVNLDSFFLERDEVISLFERKINEHCQRGCTVPANEKPSYKPLAVIEGVMGYYDGLAGISTTAASYDIANCLDCPVIFIIDIKDEDKSPELILREAVEYIPESHIRGVILNRAESADVCKLRPKAEALGVRVLGFVPESADAVVTGRHLGLTFPSDVKKFQEKISAFSDIIEETTDIDAIIELSEEAGNLPETDANTLTHPMTDEGVKRGGSFAGGKKIAVASDEAFCFIYEDNLDFLRELGYEVITFSPLHDEGLPEGLSAILLTGGYPEVYAGELSENRGMLNAIRQAFGNVKVIAECGGFMYLHESIEGTDGEVYPMAGCIKARAYKTPHSSRFGYISLFPSEESVFGGRKCEDGGCLIKAHEFHYWDSTAPGTDLTAIKPLSKKSWKCCYVNENLMAGFPHLYYRSDAGFIRSFLQEEH